MFHGPNCNHGTEMKIVDMKVTKEKSDDGKVKAVVTLTTDVNGEVKTEEHVFEGDDLEVQAAIDKLGQK